MEGDEKEIEILPVTIDHWEPLAALFATSSGVNGCWCMWPRREPRTHRPDRDGNKAEMKALLIAGESPGLVALVGGRAIGWCAVGPRDRYPQYKNDHASDTTWAIPCIYIERTADRRTVAQALIDAAAALAARNGATAIDGPPPWWLPGDAGAIAVATTTFLDNGFTQIGIGARMPQLRRTLGG